MADLISNSLRHTMLADDFMRSKLVFNNPEALKAQIADSLEETKKLLETLTPEMIAPPGILVPRHLKFYLDDDKQFEDAIAGSEAIKDLKEDSKLIFNPLATLIKADEVPQNELEECDFIIHLNHGRDELASQMRIELTSQDEDKLAFLDQLKEIKVNSPEQHLEISELDDEGALRVV